MLLRPFTSARLGLLRPFASARLGYSLGRGLSTAPMPPGDVSQLGRLNTFVNNNYQSLAALGVLSVGMFAAGISYNDMWSKLNLEKNGRLADKTLWKTELAHEKELREMHVKEAVKAALSISETTALKNSVELFYHDDYKTAREANFAAVKGNPNKVVNNRVS